MAIAKPKKSIKDFIPLLIVVAIFSAATYPQIVKTYFPSYAPEDKIIEKEKVVEVEKIVKQTPTVSLNTLKASVVRIIDADTFVADLCLPLDITLEDQHIRCLGYDGYELSEVKGQAAKQELEALFKDGEIFIMVGEQKRDSFGRVLAQVYCRKQDKVISAESWMVEHNFVKPTKAKLEEEIPQ